MSSNVVNSLGLILDMIGVGNLFKFGFPQPDLDDSIKVVAGIDPETTARRMFGSAYPLPSASCE